MGCGTGLMKWVLIICNIIFLLLGLAALGGGIWMAISPSTLFDLFEKSETDIIGGEDLVKTAAYIAIGAGCVIVLVALLGVIGACTKSKIALGIYAVFLFLVLGIEIAAIAVIVIYDQKFSEDFKTNLLTAMKKQYKNDPENNDEFTKAMDEVFQEFQCCGVNKATDFPTTPNSPEWDFWSSNGDSKTIVNQKPTACYADKNDANTLYDKGCYQAIRDKIMQYKWVVVGIMIAILVFELLLFIFAICLCCTKSDDNKFV